MSQSTSLIPTADPMPGSMKETGTILRSETSRGTGSPGIFEGLPSLCACKRDPLWRCGTATRFQGQNSHSEVRSGDFDVGQAVLTVQRRQSVVSTTNNMSTVYFITFLIATIISWVLVDLWGKVLYNLAYVTFDMKPGSTKHSFIVAGVCTLVFILYIIMIEPVGSDIRLKIMGSGPVEATSLGH
jgi:hypothetical protein